MPVLLQFSHSISRYHGQGTKQKPLHVLFLFEFMLNCAAVMVIELIVFSHNKAIIQ